MTRLEGIDVSAYQTHTPPLTGLSFAFARATYSTTQDGMYPQHVAAFRAAGLVVGAYAFGNGVHSGKDEATAFLASTTRGTPDLYVLDLEHDGNATMSLIQAREFIATVQAAGHKCGLYHSESGFPDVGQDWNWIANWSAEPTHPWTFWQYRGSPLDLDRFVGTLDQLKTLAGIIPPTPPPVVIRYGATKLLKPRRYAVQYAKTNLRSTPRKGDNVVKVLPKGALFDAYQYVVNASGKWIGNRDGTRWLLFAGVSFVKYL